MPRRRQASPPSWLARLEALPDRTLAWSVVAVAALARLLHFATLRGPTWAEPVLDGDTNLQLAAQLLSQPPEDPYWQPPLYPALLSLCLRLSSSLLVPRLLVAALSCATAAATFALARAATLARPRALLAGLLVALHGPLLFYDGELLPTSLATALVTFALLASVRLRERPLRGLLVGALAGLATLAVGTLALVTPALALASSGPRSRRLEYAAAVLIGALFVVAPVVRHNRLHGGGGVIALNGGINLWIGNNPAMNDLVAVRPGAAWEALSDEPARTTSLAQPSDYDAYFVRKTRAFCAARPALCLRNVAEKLAQLAHSLELPRNESLYLARTHAPVLAALTFRLGSLGVPGALLLPLAAAGLAAHGTLRRARSTSREDPDTASPDDAPEVAPPPPVWPLLTRSLALLALGPIVFFVAGRYRVPMVPLLAVFAAAGLGALRIHDARRAPVIAALLALVAAVRPLHLPVLAVDYAAEEQYLVAGVRQRRGDLGGAEQALREALALRPDYPEAKVNLGLMCLDRGRADEAVRWLREASAQLPDERLPRMSLARALVARGELDEARALVREQLQRDPSDREAQEVWRLLRGRDR